MNHPTVLTHLTSPEGHCCTNKSKRSSAFEDERSPFSLSLRQVHPLLLSSQQQSNTRTPPLPPQNWTEETLIPDKAVGPSAGSSLSTSICDHSHYRSSVPGGSSLQLLVYSQFPAAHGAATSFSGSLRLLHLSPGYTPPLPNSHGSRHYSDLPINFFLLIISSSVPKSHLHPSTLCYTLKAGQFVTGGQKDRGKLSIWQHYTVVSGTTKNKTLPVQGFGQKGTFRALRAAWLRRHTASLSFPQKNYFARGMFWQMAFQNKPWAPR